MKPPYKKILQLKFDSLIYFSLVTILLGACRNSVNESNDNLFKLLCIPYTVSNEKTQKTYFLEPFGRIESEVNAEIIYHVLPDKNQGPYITLEGFKDIIDRIEYVVNYNNLYNQHELLIKYSKCMIKSRMRSVKINVYGHELFEAQISRGSFASTDTIRSNVGKLTLLDAGDSYFNIVCNVPILLMDLTSVSYFVLNGIVGSCIFQIRADGGKSPVNPSNLRNLEYRSLYFRENSGPYWNDIPKIVNIFAGRPKRITYFVDWPYVKLYYQGNPEIVTFGSRYNPLIWEP